MKRRSLIGIGLLLSLWMGCRPSALPGSDDGGLFPDGRPDAGPPTDDGGTDGGRPTRPLRPNAISNENITKGSSDWAISKAGGTGEIEGYALSESINVGEKLGIAVSVNTPKKFTWVAYRMGHYGGLGAREIARGGPISATPQAACAPQSATGLVSCPWAASFTIETTPNWVRGLYLVKLTREDGFQQYVPFVLRDDDTDPQVVVILPTSTWQAYNTYGGESLYDDAHKITGSGRAFQVSFDRPYVRDSGAGHFLRSDRSLISWLEAQGLNVVYITNGDLDRSPEVLRKADAFIVSGHDEYWSRGNRVAADEAVASGTSLLNLGANNAYWQIRFEPASDGRERRIITCYKQDAPKRDPVGAQSPLLTVKFRSPPVSHPESQLFGAMFNETWNTFSFPTVIRNAGHWALEGTGLSDGDTLWQSNGYEWDQVDSSSENPPEILADSPALSLVRGFARGQMVIREQNGGWVFSSGGIDFVDLLSSKSAADPRAGRIVANVLFRALGWTVPSDLQTFTSPAPSPAEGPFAREVRTVAGMPADAEEGPLGAPIAIAPLPSGGFALLDGAADTVRVLNSSGEVRKLSLSAHGTLMGLAADAQGNLYLSDMGNSSIRVLRPDGSFSLLAGADGVPGNTDGPAAQARFFMPGALSVAPDGALLVADVGVGSIRRIDLRTQTVSTVTGATGLSRPTAVAQTSDGALVVLETGNCRVLQIRQGQSQVLAGGACGFTDGPAAQAGFLAYGGLAVLADGSLAVADPGNYRIRRIVNGRVTTLAGSGKFGHRDGRGDQSDFVVPSGLAVAAGVLYVADSGNGTLRAVLP